MGIMCIYIFAHSASFGTNRVKTRRCYLLLPVLLLLVQAFGLLLFWPSTRMGETDAVRCKSESFITNLMADRHELWHLNELLVMYAVQVKHTESHNQSIWEYKITVCCLYYLCCQFSHCCLIFYDNFLIYVFLCFLFSVSAFTAVSYLLLQLSFFLLSVPYYLILQCCNFHISFLIHFLSVPYYLVLQCCNFRISFLIICILPLSSSVLQLSPVHQTP